jgi:hypothetical protein
MTRWDILSDQLIQLKQEYGYPTCFDMDEEIMIIGTSFGHLLIFERLHQALVSIVTLDPQKLAEIAQTPLVGMCISSLLMFKNDCKCCVGFSNGHMGLFSYRKSSSVSWKWLLPQIHQTSIVRLLRLRESRQLFLSQDASGKVYVVFIDDHQKMKCKCIAGAKNDHNRVLGIALCPYGTMATRPIVFVYSNRVSCMIERTLPPLYSFKKTFLSNSYGRFSFAPFFVSLNVWVDLNFRHRKTMY